MNLEFRQWFKAKVICINAFLYLFPFDENICNFRLSLYGSLQAWDIETKVPNIGFNSTFILKKQDTNIKMYAIDALTSEISQAGQILIR